MSRHKMRAHMRSVCGRISPADAGDMLVTITVTLNRFTTLRVVVKTLLGFDPPGYPARE